MDRCLTCVCIKTRNGVDCRETSCADLHVACKWWEKIGVSVRVIAQSTSNLLMQTGKNCGVCLVKFIEGTG